MRILIIGEFNHYISNATKMAHQLGARVTHSADLEKALQFIRSTGADLIFVDAGLDIANLVGHLKSERCLTPLIAYGINIDPTRARNAIHAGARDYIPFPPDPELIAAILASIASDNRHFIARDPKTIAVKTLAERIAQSDASVLITGESGTGKEVVSRFIHSQSRRSGKPFISINCAAIPETLLESELFGYEKGAFTGAVARRIGKFEEAMGGTLLLDEVTEMSAALQSKLLRVLQERVIERIGSNKPIPVDIRILATSNRNIANAIEAQNFREDLYYRLNVVSIVMPPLRERPEDILDLAEHFIEKYSNANGIDRKPISSNARNTLLTYAWPGNIRELENIIHRSVLLASGQCIEIEIPTMNALPVEFSNPMFDQVRHAANTAMHQFVGRTIEDVERELILSTLDSCGGNRTHAAKILGISIRTLRNKLHDYVETGHFRRDSFELAG